MCEIAPLAGLKKHAKTAGSDDFPYIWRANERRGISVSRPHLEGNDQQNGHQVAESGGNKGQLSYFVEANCPILWKPIVTISACTTRWN